jgi:putative ABC transport system substrate-binding protein
MISTFRSVVAHLVPPALLLLLMVAPLAAWTQPAAKPYRIGILLPFTPDTIAAKRVTLQPPFEAGMREHGWIGGRNVEFFYRTHMSVDELVGLPVDVLVAFGGTHEAAMRATRTVPIVAHFDDVNVRSEAVKSLSQPGGNVTGITFEGQGGLGSKRLALLKETAPTIKRVARLYTSQPLRFGSESELLPEYRSAARVLGLEIFPVWASTPEELRKVFADLSRRGDVGILVGPLNRRPGLEPRWDALLELTSRYRIPAIFDLPRAVDDGGLMGYGEDFAVPMRRLAYFVDRILRGAKPGDLPIEQGNRFELVVNLKAAQSIGLNIPQSVLLQADRLIH